MLRWIVPSPESGPLSFRRQLPTQASVSLFWVSIRFTWFAPAWENSQPVSQSVSHPCGIYNSLGGWM